MIARRHLTRARALALVCLASGCAASDPCSGRSGTCIVLTVQGAEAGLNALAVTVDAPATKTETTRTMAITLPMQLGLNLPASVSGTVNITVAGLKDGRAIASGHGNATVTHNRGSSVVTIGSSSSVGDMSGNSGSDGAGDMSGDMSGAIVVSAAAPGPLTVQVGRTPPQVQFTATIAGHDVAASWSVDRADIATIDATGLLTPTGTMAGPIAVQATYMGHGGSSSYTINLLLAQNGDASGGTMPGAGGIGGNGFATTVNGSQQQLLTGAATADSSIAMLYPYDGTVWPQAIPAPLLAWSYGAHAFDAIYVHATEKYVEYQGFLGKNTAPFANVPFPQNAWSLLTGNNHGEPLVVTLSFLQGGNLYGPITLTWKIASAPLPGRIYYNSYGTQLVTNFCCALVGSTTTTPLGAAVLMVRPSQSQNPVVVAGTSDPNAGNAGLSGPGCRACHSVSANGDRLTAQHGESYTTASLYALDKSNAETPLAPMSALAAAAISPDGTLSLQSTEVASGVSNNALYSLTQDAAASAMGLQTSVLLAMPAFSPDGQHVAGSNGATRGLGIYDFAAGSLTFGNYREPYVPAASSSTAVWPAYLPGGDSLVFELQVLSNGRDYGGTRSTCEGGGACSNAGAEGELWSIALATGTTARLDKANGKGYTPTNADHADDSVLNYQPWSAPVAAGGYVWIAFTSRRIYANVATINPWWSDPRFHDISATPTPKKIWIAAIDPNAPAGSDGSHPAFYLPSQELLAGNSRPIWVQDP